MNSWTRGRQLACVAGVAATALLAFGPRAHAQTGPVTGTVTLADPASRGEPPPRNRGFLPRMTNPIVAPRKYNPLPWLIVVLEPRGELTEEQREPLKVPPSYVLAGETFITPTFAVAAGGEVAIKNKSGHARRLYSPTVATLLDGDTINPGGDRITKLSTPYQVVQIRDHDSAHLAGQIVVFPLRYVSLVADDGTFTIPNVPAGRWTARLWYRNGWLKAKKQTFTVTARRGGKVSLSMPAIIEIDVPHAAKEGT